jgi:DNA-binding MurR/RpiR family transcriptional regulator
MKKSGRSRPGAGANGEESSSGTPLEIRFRNARERLNPRRQNLIGSILDHAPETYFLSSHDLARRYKVDAATIVRTVQALGYRRFSDFSADLRRQFVARMSPYTVMIVAAHERRSIEGRIRESVDRDLENLGQVQRTLDLGRVAEVARRIHRARRIQVVGVDLMAPLAEFFAYGLLPLGLSAEAPVGSSGNLYHKIRLLGPRDLLVAISFGRCLRETVEAAKRARHRGVPTVAITDSASTPLARSCDDVLIASISSPVVTGSLVAPMGVMNALLTACAYVRPKASMALLRQTEEEYRSGAWWYRDPIETGKK